MNSELVNEWKTNEVQICWYESHLRYLIYNLKSSDNEKEFKEVKKQLLQLKNEQSKISDKLWESI